MASPPPEDDDARAGPSDLLLDLQLSSDDEADYQDMLDHLERQHAFQTRLLQQSGAGDTSIQRGAGGLDTSIGTFDFELQPFVDRTSRRMGVRERHFNTRLRQRGNLIPDQNITEALQEGLRRAVNQVLTTTPDLDDQDRLYFTVGSNRLHNNFQGWGLRAGEWRQGGDRSLGASLEQQRTI